MKYRFSIGEEVVIVKTRNGFTRLLGEVGVIKAVTHGYEINEGRNFKRCESSDDYGYSLQGFVYNFPEDSLAKKPKDEGCGSFEELMKDLTTDKVKL